MGLALVKSKLHLDGKCISSIITAEEMREYNVLPKHLDGIRQPASRDKGRGSSSLFIPDR